MKISAAVSLSVLSPVLAQGALLEHIQRKIDQHFHFTDNNGLRIDFAPYLKADFQDFGSKAEIRCSTTGVNIDEINYEVTKNGYKNWGFAYGINMFNAGMDIGSVIETISYNDHGEWTTGPMGVEIDMSRDITINFKEEVQSQSLPGKVKERMNLDLGFSSSGPSVALSIDFDASKTSTNVEPTKRFTPKSVIDLMNNDLFTDDGKIEFDGAITIPNMKGCKNLQKGVLGNCRVNYESTLNLPAKAPLKHQASLQFKAYAIVFKFGESGRGEAMIFLRGEDGKSNSAPLISRQWFGLYQAPGSNWQKAIKTGKSQLLLRVPSPRQFKKSCSSDLKNLIKPWANFGMTCLGNPEKIPYVIWYMDKLFATFDDEFDLSKVISKSRIQSDVIGEWLGAENNNLNKYLVKMSRQTNRLIVRTLQDPTLKNAMIMVRDYVQAMGSQQGHQEFEQLFGKIF